MKSRKQMIFTFHHEHPSIVNISYTSTLTEMPSPIAITNFKALGRRRRRMEEKSSITKLELKSHSIKKR